MSWFAQRPNAVAPNGSAVSPAETTVVPKREPIREDPAPVPVSEQFTEAKFRIHERLLKEMDLEKVHQQQGPALRKAIEEAAGVMLTALELPVSRTERQRLVREVVDEILGLGPLEPLLSDPTVTEIMVNGPREVYVERKGLLSRTDAAFRDEAHIMRIIDRIVSPLGRRIDESSPMVDARLQDGSRVNAVIPPLCVDSPTLTIRRFSKDPLTVDNLIEFGTLTPSIATFLRACVESRTNMIVSGGTGSGKTTLLNVLSSFIPVRERVVTIEDPCELQMRQPHVVRLETRPANIEGRGEVNQRALLKNALRMRPDRIIVGEVRGGEAFDMLQAMNTGHDGSLTTAHANTPRDVLARIENMVLMASLELPIRAIREQIASAINVIVHVSRMRDGSRRLTHVTEVVGMEGEMITLQDIFLFRQQGVDAEGKVVGTLLPTGLRPHCVEKFEQDGITLPPDIFTIRNPNGRGAHR